mgnify:CR=1 FL=1
MKILFDNVDFNSNSGPNGFGKKLATALGGEGHQIFINPLEAISPDVQISFIASNYRLAPIIQRLDGIYFNSDQDFNRLNEPIEKTYLISEAVIFQSEFNKALTEKFFGIKEKSFVIHNGTALDEISNISPINSEDLDRFENVWTCASSWRPHKRLEENVRYFLENSSQNDCLIVAGSNPDCKLDHPRVFYAGVLDWKTLISLYKRSKFFLHLAWLDHCPNVVIDARAAGCHVICSSSGGTHEIAGENSTIIEEDIWDFSPLRLYNPPKMDFSKKTNIGKRSDIDIKSVSLRYLDVFSECIK